MKRCEQRSRIRPGGAGHAAPRGLGWAPPRRRVKSRTARAGPYPLVRPARAADQRSSRRPASSGESRWLDFAKRLCRGMSGAARHFSVRRGPKFGALQGFSGNGVMRRRSADHPEHSAERRVGRRGKALPRTWRLGCVSVAASVRVPPLWSALRRPTEDGGHRSRLAGVVRLVEGLESELGGRVVG